ncbi:hypothetical protein CUJ88_49265 (plasmid) [Paraburkholderia hospita]|nr:hypothetical protein CUJ88_49265 [Paraburkholderia hospita]
MHVNDRVAVAKQAGKAELAFYCGGRKPAKNGPSHSIGERLLTSDEPPFGKAATDDSSDEPAHFQVLCAADQIR